jgi:hypothetical protein
MEHFTEVLIVGSNIALAVVTGVLVWLGIRDSQREEHRHEEHDREIEVREAEARAMHELAERLTSLHPKEVEGEVIADHSNE